MKKLFLFLAIFGISLTLASLAPRFARSWLAARLYQRLGAIDDNEVPAIASQLAVLGDPGVEALVDGLYHERPIVQSTAYELLCSQIDGEQLSVASESASGQLRIMSILADRAKDADDSVLRMGEQLALKVLRSPPPASATEPTALTYACEQVIQAARSVRGKAESSEPIGPEQTLVNTIVPSSENEEALAPTNSSPPLEPPAAIEPRLHNIHQSLPQPILTARSQSDSLHQFTPSMESLTDDVESVIELAAMTDVEVMKRLAIGHGNASASEELRRRGFSELEVRVATVWADPDPEVRNRLALTLPDLAGVDGHAWLVLLSRDESPRVRATAVRWLATSNDPRIREYLREVANSETDETVRHALRPRRSID